MENRRITRRRRIPDKLGGIELRHVPSVGRARWKEMSHGGSWVRSCPTGSNIEVLNVKSNLSDVLRIIGCRNGDGYGADGD